MTSDSGKARREPLSTSGENMEQWWTAGLQKLAFSRSSQSNPGHHLKKNRRTPSTSVTVSFHASGKRKRLGANVLIWDLNYVMWLTEPWNQKILRNNGGPSFCDLQQKRTWILQQGCNPKSLHRDVNDSLPVRENDWFQMLLPGVVQPVTRLRWASTFSTHGQVTKEIFFPPFINKITIYKRNLFCLDYLCPIFVW